MPFDTYTEFEDSSSYGSSPSGAQLAVKFVSDRDVSQSFTGLTSHDLRGDLEVVPIREGGESGVREFARGAGEYRGNGSCFFTSKRGDLLSVSQANFLQLGPFTAYVYDGKSWNDTAGILRYVVVGLVFESVSVQHGSQGDVRIDFSYQAQNWIMGHEWQATTGVGVVA